MTWPKKGHRVVWVCQWSHQSFIYQSKHNTGRIIWLSCGQLYSHTGRMIRQKMIILVV
ncbi:hypothetical protein Hanom_Chr07g00670841 [Helianthus anomalus]